MSPRWPVKPRTSWSGRRLATTALILFFMLCGLTLIFSRQPGEMDLDQGTPAQVLRALTSLEQASQALEAQNYGSARAYLQEARGTLLNTLPP